jgi:hypothetical protein
LEHYVFLSYSFKDIHRARRLRDALHYYGWASWPNDTLTPGLPAWKKAMHERLDQAVCVVVILSKDTLLSNWVAKTLRYAITHDIPVLPVLMDGEPGHRLLIDLDGDSWFDLRWSRNFRAEMAELSEAIKRCDVDKIARNA